MNYTSQQYCMGIIYMTRVKLVSISFFFMFISCFLILNQFENIPPQNKDIEVAPVQKLCLIKLLLSILELKSSESSEFGFGF